MPRQVYLFDEPERFIAGTVGEPGDRAFYLQAVDGTSATAVLLEKEQVAILAEKVVELIDGVRRDHPELLGAARVEPDNAPLRSPVDEEFRVQAMGVGFNQATGQIVFEAHADGEGDDWDVPELEENPDDAPDVLRVRMTCDYALEFARRAAEVVSAGRPPCPLCSLPLDPTGHICPRANGYLRR